MGTIEQRLAALERSARRWRFSAVSIGILLAAALLMGAEEKSKVPEELQVKRLAIVDDGGKTLASLDKSQLTIKRLVVVNDKGRRVAALDASDKGGALTLRSNGDSTRNVVTIEAALEGGTVDLRLDDDDSKGDFPKGSLTMTSNRNGGQILTTLADGKLGISLSSGEKGSEITTYAPTRGQATLMGDKDLGAIILIKDKAGQVVFSKP